MRGCLGGVAYGAERGAAVTSDWRAALRADGRERRRRASTPTRSRCELASGSRRVDPDATAERSRTARRHRAAAEAPRRIGRRQRRVGGLFGGSMASLDSLDEIAKHIASCTRCPLYSTATNPVPGEGNPNADFMCVGEAPGANEDETGRAVRRRGRSAAHKDPRGDRSAARGRVHLQRPQAPAAGKPQSAAG